MEIAIRGDDALTERWKTIAGKQQADVIVINGPQDLLTHPYDLCIDTLGNEQEQDEYLSAVAKGSIVMVGGIMQRTADRHAMLVYFNNWPGQAFENKMELACGSDPIREKAHLLLEMLGIETLWVPNQPGLITPRVISQIINEAYLAVEEGVSTAEEIDTAMKLGTNYPFGPFEWCEQIGKQHVYELLDILSLVDGRYTPAQSLKQAILKKKK